MSLESSSAFTFYGEFVPPAVSDCPKNTKEQLAEWFEKTVERFGYDVGK